MRFFIFLLFIFTLSAQLFQISGKVYDESGQELEFVNVYIENSIKGTITDEKGFFLLKGLKKKRGILVFQFTGYKSEKFDISKYTGELTIILREDISREDIVEVVASAFITDEKKKAVVARPLDVVTTPGAAADINRFYQTMPGVAAVDDGAGLFVRGGHVSETVMEIDGARIIHPYRYESPSGGFFGTITPFLTKGSAFYTGALSSKYGNVLSGMVDMESVDLADKNQYVFVLGLAAISGRVDHVFLDEKLSSSFSGNVSDTKHFMSFNGSRRNFTSFPKSHDLNLNLNYKIKPDLNLKLFLFREHNSAGLGLDVPDSDISYYGESTNTLANLRLKGLLTNNVVFSSNIAFTEYESETDLGSAGSVVNDKLIQGKFTVEVPIAELSTIYAGIDLQGIRYNYNGNWHSNVDSIYQGVGGTNYIEDVDAFYSGSYLELKSPLSKDFVFNTGFRFEYNNKEKMLHIDPRLSVAYQVSDQLNFSASYGVYHQIPELVYYVNNQGLLSKKSESFVFGLTYNVEKTFLLKSEIYYKKYRNLIRNLSNNNDRNYNNEGHGTSQGFDLLFKHKGNSFEYWLSYSWLTAERLEDDFVVLTSPEFDITNNFTIVYKQNLSSSFMAGIKYVYHTGKPYRFSQDPGLINKKRLPSYSRTDINFSYLLSLYPGNLTTVFLSFNNIFGKENILNKRYNSDYTKFLEQKSTFLRSVYFGFSLSF